MKTILLSLLILSGIVAAIANETNLTITFHTEDLPLLRTNLTPTQAVQLAADKAVKDKQRLYILNAFERATEDQRRALVGYVAANIPN